VGKKFFSLPPQGFLKATETYESEWGISKILSAFQIYSEGVNDFKVKAWTLTVGNVITD
jgi:hypothetical protein